MGKTMAAKIWEDHIVVSPPGWRNEQLLHAKLGTSCRWSTFDGEHFLLAEPCRDRVIDSVLGWIENEVI
jgi:surfactin synthase thioesterase subunit